MRTDQLYFKRNATYTFERDNFGNPDFKIAFAFCSATVSDTLKTLTEDFIVYLSLAHGVDKIGNSKYVSCVKIALIASSRKETVLTTNNSMWKIIHNQICMNFMNLVNKLNCN